MAASPPRPEAPPVVTPREWVRLLGGEDVLAMPTDRWRALDVGVFRFGDMRDPVVVPPIDHHYVSFTVRGPLLIERELGGGVERGSFRRGLSLIMAAGQTNRWRWDQPTTELQLYLRPSFLEETAQQAGLQAPTLIDRFAFEDPILRHAVEGLLDELRDPTAAGALFGDVAAQFVALHLLRRHCTSARLGDEVARGLTPRQLRRVSELADARLGDDLTLDDLAAAAGLSRFHFARAFRRSTGTSPHRWLVARRMARARELLAATDLPDRRGRAAARLPQPEPLRPGLPPRRGRHPGRVPPHRPVLVAARSRQRAHGAERRRGGGCRQWSDRRSHG